MRFDCRKNKTTSSRAGRSAVLHT